MIKTCFLFLFLCILVGCSNNRIIGDSIYILDGELSRSYQDIDNSLSIKRSKLSFSEGKEAYNCKSYFSLFPQYALEESVYNQQVKSEYLICDALKILSGSTGESSDEVKSLALGENLLSKLDLRTFPSSLNQAASDSSHTLKSLYPNQTSFSGNVAEFQTEDWVLALEVVVVARINDNLEPDWVVWVTDESKSGNYRGYSTIIIYDPDDKVTFKATTYP
jgi:hypothetical protein